VSIKNLEEAEKTNFMVDFGRDEDSQEAFFSNGGLFFRKFSVDFFLKNLKLNSISLSFREKEGNLLRFGRKTH